MIIWLDLETYSTQDLKKVGSYVYAQDCDLLLFGYAIGDGPVKVWDAYSDPTIPSDLHRALSDPNNKLVAHNVGFEMPVLKATLPEYDWSLERWIDSSIIAVTNGLPFDLARSSSEANTFESDTIKNKDGRRLVLMFCKPAAATHKAYRYGPENKADDWELFIDYCADDVGAMRDMCLKLDQANYKMEEANWKLNMRMNHRGLPMDRTTAAKMVETIEGATAYSNAEMARMTDGKVSGVKQTSNLREWLETEGFAMPNVQAATLSGALKRTDIPDYIRDVIELRTRAGGTSTSKYTAILNATANDGCIHGAFQFYGAFRTGREAGRIFQPQNLPRPELKHPVIEDVIERIGNGDRLQPSKVHMAASSCLRAMLMAPEGTVLNVADLANIEGRKLAWLAEEDWKVQAFYDYDTVTGVDDDGKPTRLGADLYKLAYARSFNVDVETVGDAERQIGKVQELALGYQGGAGAFATFAANFSIDLTTLIEPTMANANDHQIDKANQMWVWAVENRRTGGMARDVFTACDIIKQAWRSAHPNVVNLWWSTHRAVISAMDEPELWFNAGRCNICHLPQRKQLLIRLPSGRDIIYWDPQYDPDSGDVTYMGLDTYTRQWKRMSSYGGKWVENICQASARDVLFFGAHEAERAGFDIRGTVHDELVTLADSDRHHELEACMATVPDWCEGLPLSAEGYASKRYRK